MIVQFALFWCRKKKQDYLDWIYDGLWSTDFYKTAQHTFHLSSRGPTAGPSFKEALGASQVALSTYDFYVTR